MPHSLKFSAKGNTGKARALSASEGRATYDFSPSDNKLLNRSKIQWKKNSSCKRMIQNKRRYFN
jgi:hypothetical protein